MELPFFFCSSLFSLIVCLQNSSSFLLGKKNNSCLMSYVPKIARVGPIGYIVLWGLLIWCHTQNSSCRKCCTNVPLGQFSTVFLMHLMIVTTGRELEIWILNVVNILRVTSQLSYNTLLHITWISFVSKYLNKLIWNKILKYYSYSKKKIIVWIKVVKIGILRKIVRDGWDRGS